jgi:hypothetical protein
MEYLIVIALNIILFVILLLISIYYKNKPTFINDNKIGLEEQKFIKSALFIYLIWACIQQGVVVGVFTLLKNFNIPINYCILICSFIFMIIHIPNVLLMFSVLGMQLILLILFSQSTLWFIIPMILTHSLLATSLYYFFPESIHKNFKVLLSFYKKYKKLY